MRLEESLQNMQYAAMQMSFIDMANCSVAPACEGLHRHNCSASSHTCGPCLQGYDGVAGDFNSACSLNGDSEVVTEGEPCLRDGDCQYKSCQGNVCVTPPPVCPLGKVTGLEFSGAVHGACSLFNFQGVL